MGHNLARRRKYSDADLDRLVAVAVSTSTETAAQSCGSSAKALRSLFRRHQISLGARQRERKQSSRAHGYGLFVITPTTPAVIYAGAALAQTEGCRWPIGDTAAADFCFCNAKRAPGHRSYCATHAGVSRPQKAKTPAEKAGV